MQAFFSSPQPGQQRTDLGPYLAQPGCRDVCCTGRPFSAFSLVFIIIGWPVFTGKKQLLPLKLYICKPEATFIHWSRLCLCSSSTSHDGLSIIKRSQTFLHDQTLRNGSLYLFYSLHRCQCMSSCAQSRSVKSLPKHLASFSSPLSGSVQHLRAMLGASCSAILGYIFWRYCIEAYRLNISTTASWRDLCKCLFTLTGLYELFRRNDNGFQCQTLYQCVPGIQVTAPLTLPR